MELTPDLLKQYLLTAVRWAIGLFGAKVIAWVSAQAGIPVAETTQVIAGVIVGGLMFVWALMNKSHADQKITTALELPADSSRSKLADVMEKK